MSTTFDDSVASVERPRLVIQGETDSFWRKEEPVMSPDGLRIVRGGMWDHQREFWDHKAFIKVLVGGYGSGKTNIMGKRFISLALENAPCPVAVVSPTFPLARHTIIATIKDLCAGKQTVFGKAFKWRFNKTTHTFTIKYHGRVGTIVIYSGEDPDSLRGPNLAAAGIDEPFIQDEAVFAQMIARVRHPDAKIRELCLTGTPEQLNWGYDLCMGELKNRYADFDIDVHTVTASTRMNRALDAGYVKRLEGALTDKAVDAYVEGKFVNLAKGLVYYAFDPTPGGSHVQSLEIPEEAELGVGMDFNVNPFAFVVFWKAGSHMHFFKEFELDNADTEYAVQLLRERFVDDKDERNGIKGRITPQRLTFVYPDASGSARKTSAPGGKTDFHFIREGGFTIMAHPANPKRKDRYNAVNGKLRPKQGKPTLTVDPACKKLIKYLANHSHELMNKQQHMTHLLDAFSYPVEYLFPVKRGSGVYKLSGA